MSDETRASDITGTIAFAHNDADNMADEANQQPDWLMPTWAQAPAPVGVYNAI